MTHSTTTPSLTAPDVTSAVERVRAMAAMTTVDPTPLDAYGRCEATFGDLRTILSDHARLSAALGEAREALRRAADDLRDIGTQSPRPSNSPDPEHENYLRRVLISLGQVGHARARTALQQQEARDGRE